MAPRWTREKELLMVLHVTPLNLWPSDHELSVVTTALYDYKHIYNYITTTGTSDLGKKSLTNIIFSVFDWIAGYYM